MASTTTPSSAFSAQDYLPSSGLSPLAVLNQAIARSGEVTSSGDSATVTMSHGMGTRAYAGPGGVTYMIPPTATNSAHLGEGLPSTPVNLQPPPEGTQWHKRFNFPDGNIVLVVGKTSFKVHRYFFERDSTSFASAFSQPSTTSPFGNSGSIRPLSKTISPQSLPFGTTSPQSVLAIIPAFTLVGVTSEQMEAFLSVLFPMNFNDGDLTTEAEWQSVLVLADMWHFKTVRERAIRQLDFLVSSFQRLMLAHEYKIEEWVTPALADLCARDGSLKLEEIRQMHHEDITLVVNIREKVRGPPASSTSKESLCTQVDEWRARASSPQPFIEHLKCLSESRTSAEVSKAMPGKTTIGEKATTSSDRDGTPQVVLDSKVIQAYNTYYRTLRALFPPPPNPPPAPLTLNPRASHPMQLPGLYPPSQPDSSYLGPYSQRYPPPPLNWRESSVPKGDKDTVNNAMAYPNMKEIIDSMRNLTSKTTTPNVAVSPGQYYPPHLHPTVVKAPPKGQGNLLSNDSNWTNIINSLEALKLKPPGPNLTMSTSQHFAASQKAGEDDSVTSEDQRVDKRDMAFSLSALSADEGSGKGTDDVASFNRAAPSLFSVDRSSATQEVDVNKVASIPYSSLTRSDAVASTDTTETKLSGSGSSGREDNLPQEALVKDSDVKGDSDTEVVDGNFSDISSVESGVSESASA